MLDLNAVQQLAFECGYHELVCYVEEHHREYWCFNLTDEE